jgi:rhomboid family GlyGly-CTERM serine protease
VPEKSAARGSRSGPWFTLGLALAAIVIHVTGCGPALLYQRADILTGAVWRAWTGHWVHFSASHLLWNLCVFIPAGGWLEIVRPRTARWFYLASPAFISGVLLVADPGLATYGGLSGIATGLLVCLACLRLGDRSGATPAWFWWGILIIVAAKIVAESLYGQPLLVTGFDRIRDVPLAHVAGAALGIVFGLAARVRERGHRHVG